MGEKEGLSGFFGFLKGKKGAVFAAVLLLLGALILMSGGIGESERAVELSDEERLAALCSSIDGVGECKVYLAYEPTGRTSSSGRVESVAIVCRGASSLEVRAKLTELASSLYGIGVNRISISKMAD